MRFVLRLLGLLALAVALSGAWLFRGELIDYARPQVENLRDALGAGGGPRGAEPAGELPEPTPAPAPATPAGLERAHDKVDSLHGWAADSVVLSPREMAALLVEGLPSEARDRVDSVRVSFGDGRVTVAARLETTRIPASALGPLAGALEPWEPVSGSGVVATTAPGRAEWRVDALTLRGFTLPEVTSRQLVSRALPGVRDGAVPFRLPRGIARIRIRPTGATLYRETR